MTKTKSDFLILGAGPAGLTAAAELMKRNIQPIIVEKDCTYVGGISRTETHNGFRFDIGGHRFFSKSGEITQWWKNALGPELIQRPRSSMIYFNGKFFAYPLKAGEALFKLGIFQSVFCVIDYLKARLFPIKKVRSFEDWVVNNFGRRLFRMFFKTYTEKVWGIPCEEISADWAAQRIKGFSLGQAIKGAVFNSLGIRSSTDSKIKTIINSFLYPRLGPGQMWETVAEKITKNGGELLMGTQPVSIKKEKDNSYMVTLATADGNTSIVHAKHLISSIPLSELASLVSDDKTALKAARSLRYRDFITVAIFLEKTELFEDNWIYIHDPKVNVGRIQNYKSWSPEMVPDQTKDCLGLEYFCNQEDSFWAMQDDDLIALAKKELLQLKLVPDESCITGGYVVRQERAYPVYTGDYKDAVKTIRKAFEKNHPSLHCVGRNGMHKYNNQDHAMMTSILTVANICDGKNFDIWGVNEDAEYHEKLPEDRKYATQSLIEPPQKI